MDIIGTPIEIGADVVFYNKGLKVGTVINKKPLIVQYLNEQIKVDEVYLIEYDEQPNVDDWPDVCIMEEY